MPQRKNAIEELKKNRKRRMQNLDIKTDLRKTVKAFTDAAAANPEEAKKLLSIVYKKMDKAAKRNVLDKKTASRRKSRFARLLLVKKA